MSTGLTFGTISALFGLSHQIITLEQYSYLVAVVIGSAVVAIIANAAWTFARTSIRNARAALLTGASAPAPFSPC